jgi:hypothetical protein
MDDDDELPPGVEPASAPAPSSAGKAAMQQHAKMYVAMLAADATSVSVQRRRT